MKLKNLAFFGVMASILSVASAQAANENYIASKGYVDSKVNTVSGSISDIATIRENAAAGKAASTTIATYGDVVTHDAADFATAEQGTKADNAAPQATTYTKTETNEAISTAISTASGNYATAEQGAKADTAVQSVESGTTNGTIAVDGEDVAVTGLGSAAYQNTTAFDAAGAATAAQTAAQNYTNTQLANYTTTTDMNTALDAKANSADVYSQTAADAKFATQTALTEGLATKANSATTYTKTEVDSAITAATENLATAANVYTKDAADAKFATQTATTEALAGKQDTINDLTTIRSGAAAGATALQSNSELNGANLTAGSVAKTALATAVQNAIDNALVANSAIDSSTANSIVQYDAKGLVVSGTPAGTLATVSPATNTCPAGRTCVVTKDSDGNHLYTPVTLDNEQ